MASPTVPYIHKVDPANVSGGTSPLPKIPRRIELMTLDERREANKFLVKHLQAGFTDCRKELLELRDKLSITYWVIVVLSVVMFILGIVLLSVPVVSALTGEFDAVQSLIAAGFGIADLAALFLFRPVEQIHQLMGDMSQIALSLNSYQTQVGLRLLEMDVEDRSEMSKAADQVGMTTISVIKLVQNYFERKSQ